MSLFIGLLAFPTSPELQDAVKIGVLWGSVLSGSGRRDRPEVRTVMSRAPTAPPILILDLTRAFTVAA
jgi:hypothetical protein